MVWGGGGVETNVTKCVCVGRMNVKNVTKYVCVCMGGVGTSVCQRVCACVCVCVCVGGVE